MSETFTGGKNGFLIEGSPFLKETTDIKIEILDVEGNPLFFEPGNGIPEYYEGNSKLVAVHVYDDTPIGIGKITILGELKEYVTNTGATKKVPSQWRDVYNVKFEQPIQINRTLSNENIVRFYKRPLVNITELVKPIFSKSIPTKTETGYVHGESDKTGSAPLDKPIHPRELLATIYHSFGIDPETIVYNNLNQPRELVKAQAVTALFS